MYDKSARTENQMIKISKRRVLGWIAVGISTLLTSVWAFWGIIENFHEGWYFRSLTFNLGLMFVQYLSPMLLFLTITLLSIFWHRIGGGLHIFLAITGVFIFETFSNAATLLIIIPLVGLGLLYWNAVFEKRKTAITIAAGIPILTLIVSGLGPALRISKRLNDGNLNARPVYGNGVSLTWAPSGPGWPDEGLDWYEAKHNCTYLNQDGLTLALTPQNVWRLPTVSESVRSMSRHGHNSGGIWNDEAGKATYTMAPDKESPLWNEYSQVIYWWTATEVDETHAYIIVYDGKVWARNKQFGPAYLGFRCVKNR